jgi:hypothetical protein
VRDAKLRADDVEGEAGSSPGLARASSFDYPSHDRSSWSTTLGFDDLVTDRWRP